MCTQAGQLRELTRAGALRLLGSVAVGRIVFTAQALPTIRPVNHVVHRGNVIIRSHQGAALLSAVGSVVAYEADVTDEHDRIGWSVIVTGVARLVIDAEDVARYERMLCPWVPGQMDQVIRIAPELVTGFAIDRAPPMPRPVR